MLLSLSQSNFPMKLVYTISDELKKNPRRVALTQSLTLNKLKPEMGLKGSNGLFNSLEWWDSIRAGRMPLLYISGIIRRVYVAGQEQSELNNTVDLISDDGSMHSVGIYLNNNEDSSLFKVGCWVEIVYALDELKLQPAIGSKVNYSKVALEMAVSLSPIG